MATPGELSFLVVEDQALQRNVAVQLLEDLKAKSVFASASPREALQLLRTLPVPIDIVITELHFPGIDGLELIRNIGATRVAPSVIVASNVDHAIVGCVEAMSAAYGVRMLAMVDKPLTAPKLLELLELHGPATTAAARAEKPALSFTPDEIVEALENGEFEPFFQPKVEVNTWTVVGLEALARWRHPQQGIVLPRAFIGPLEDAGMIHMLLRSITRQGAAFARSLRDVGQECTLGLNLSVESLTDVTLADQITSVGASQGLEPHNTMLEITESAAATATGPVLENLARLRLRGFRLSIDDYGRGASSIEKLARIPFDEMKIDRQLLARADRQESARVVFQSSIDMARRLGMKAVAVGVESQAQWDLLAELRCDMAQGNYIAKAMSRTNYLEWLRDWTTRVMVRGPQAAAAAAAESLDMT